MRKLNSSKFVALLTGTAVIFLICITSVSAQAKLTDRAKLAINGIGPILIGMTVDEASQSAGIRLIRSGRGALDEYQCFYVQPKGEPKGIRFMVTKGRIARVDISSKRITTISGARIGDNENRILSLYPGQIKATPHPYVSRPPDN